MKIASTAMAMQSRHHAMQRTEESQRLRVWIATPTLTTAAPAAPTAPSASSPKAEAGATAPSDLRVQLLMAMLEWLTGKPVKVFDASQLQAPDSASAAGDAPVPAPADGSGARQSAGFGAEYDYHASLQEAERTDFSALGNVTTADGRKIDFAVEVAMSRSYSEQIDVSLRLGDAQINARPPAGNGQRKDPLVINLAGSAAQLSIERMSFDLDADGKKEEVPLLSGSSAYLALDRNGNGKIDSGAELFGPATGSGFTELAKYDADGNCWIDENDPIFQQLRTWRPAADGSGQLSSLKDQNVGALFLGSQETSFQLRSTRNEDLGAVRTTGVYLTESGQAGSLQQIDLTV